MTIEGIPDGWEPVRFDYAYKGESFLNGTGEIILHIYDTPTPRMRLIISKIEKPNLITLCREHHFRIGHDPDGKGPAKPNWSASNPNVRTDAKNWSKR